MAPFVLEFIVMFSKVEPSKEVAESLFPTSEINPLLFIAAELLELITEELVKENLNPEL
jgi:hypothetical protein